MNKVSFEIILILVMQKKLIKEIKEIFSMHKKKNNMSASSFKLL